MIRKCLLLCSVMLMLLPTLAGCGGSATPTPVVVVVTPGPQAEVTTVVVVTPGPQAAIQVLEATFAHGLSEQMEAVDPSTDFRPDETVYLSVRIKGRPKEGLITARFYWHENLIAEADVDLADANSGLLFSIGEDTFAGYTLTHEQAFPQSDQYRAEVFYGEQALGSYPFRVVPPLDAIPTQIKQVTLALGTDENYNPVEPTTAFAVDNTVNLVGRGDLGLATWLQAEWYVNGQLDETGTRSLTLSENAPDTGFAFSYLPEGGWPAGEHFVVLIVNDQEVGRYTFAVSAAGGAAPANRPAF